MNIETERKFLVRSVEYKTEAVESHRLKQGYIARGSGRTVRVRIADNMGYLTIKGPSPDGYSRREWERQIPLQDAEELFSLCLPGIIDKTRYIIPEASGKRFEVDEFHGGNEGLVMAEIELDDINDNFGKPPWLGEEVTGDPRYYNSFLSAKPFKTW